MRYSCCIFFFNDTATTEIYTLSLHDALPISPSRSSTCRRRRAPSSPPSSAATRPSSAPTSPTRHRWRRRRSEEHTSELQSRQNLVCRLLLEKNPDFVSIRPPISAHHAYELAS